MNTNIGSVQNIQFEKFLFNIQFQLCLFKIKIIRLKALIAVIGIYAKPSRLLLVSKRVIARSNPEKLQVYRNRMKQCARQEEIKACSRRV